MYDHSDVNSGELIEYLRRTADDIEIMLEDGEIESELELEPSISLYGLQSPYLVTYDGFIHLKRPAKSTCGEDSEDR